MTQIEPDRLHAVLRVDAHAELGEGPTWDPATGDLLWVDIFGRRVHRFNPASGTEGPSLTVAQDVGAVVPRQNGGLAMAVAGAFVLLEPGATQPATTIPVEGDRPTSRMNDGKCDPAGRFWAGTMAYAATPGAGSLYRLDPDLTVTRMIEGTTISNGLGWSPDGLTMYFIDSSLGAVDAFTFDPASGKIADRRRIIDIPPDLGLADGMTVDLAGGIWVALYGGSAIRRYHPDGTLDQIVELPCSLVTSCAFGGKLLDELFITTASVGLSAAELTSQPMAGGLFSCLPGLTGQPPTAFAG
jgi:sugar lactone lactonase YvrE